MNKRTKELAQETHVDAETYTLYTQKSRKNITLEAEIYMQKTQAERKQERKTKGEKHRKKERKKKDR